VSPTDNGVLNQIPAGDNRESSREQVVLADGALFLMSSPLGGWETTSPLGFFLDSVAEWPPLPTKKKKKKKKKVEGSRGRGGVEVEITHG